MAHRLRRCFWRPFSLGCNDLYLCTLKNVQRCAQGVEVRLEGNSISLPANFVVEKLLVHCMHMGLTAHLPCSQILMNVYNPVVNLLAMHCISPHIPQALPASEAD